VILYETVSARVPFPAATITDMAIKVATRAARAARGRAGVSRVVFKCMEKKRTAVRGIGAFRARARAVRRANRRCERRLVAKVLFDKTPRGGADLEPTRQ